MKNQTICEKMNEDFEKNIVPYIETINEVKKKNNKILVYFIVTIPLYIIKLIRRKNEIDFMKRRLQIRLDEFSQKYSEYELEKQSNIQITSPEASVVDAKFHINEKAIIEYKTTLINDFIIMKKESDCWSFHHFNDNYFDIINGEKVYKYDELIIPDGFKCKSKIFKGDFSKVKVIKIINMDKLFLNGIDGSICNKDLIGFLFEKINKCDLKLVISSGILYSELFNHTNVKSLIVEESVTEIENRALFDNKTISEIIVLNGVKKIGEFAFENCVNLENLVLPKSVSYIGRGIIKDCTALKHLSIPYLGSTRGNLNDAYFGYFYSINNTDSFDTKWLDVGCIEKLEILDGCVLIPRHAFFRCINVKNIVLPETIKKIDQEAFFSCKQLISINIPDTAILVRNGGIFRGCNSLESINIPSTTEVIDNNFWFDSYSQVNIPSTIREIYGLIDYPHYIHFEGTMAEWKKIKMSKYIKKNTKCNIVCCDGVVLKK